MEGTHLQMVVEVHLQELMHVCLNNFRPDLSTALMPLTFEGFNDIYTKAHDIEIHLSNKSAKESSDKIGLLLIATMPRERNSSIPSAISIQKTLHDEPWSNKKRLA